VTFVDKVEHFEIPADDVERARSFYMKVFGWEMNPVPGVNYTRLLTIRVDDKINLPRAFEVNGAIIKRTEDIAAPVVTITVNEMDNALKRIEQEGGKIIVGKKEFGDRGYTAYFKDTEGNIMGLWQVRAESSDSDPAPSLYILSSGSPLTITDSSSSGFPLPLVIRLRKLSSTKSNPFTHSP